jgi:hypothetical protein
VLPSPHTHPRERTLAAMLLESRRPPTGLPSELKLLLRKLANAIAQGASNDGAAAEIRGALSRSRASAADQMGIGIPSRHAA